MKLRNVRRKQRLRYARSYGVHRHCDIRTPAGAVFTMYGPWRSMPPSIMGDVWHHR